mgnify:CR=1 FL=1
MMSKSAPRRGKGKTKLAAIRRAAGLTQMELARRADVSITTIKEIEAGRTGHTLATLQAVADVLGSCPLELIKPDESVAGAEAGPAPEDLARAIPGVSWDTTNRAWLARITVRGKQVKLGAYSDVADAIAAREAAEAQHGRPRRGRPGRK